MNFLLERGVTTSVGIADASAIAGRLSTHAHKNARYRKSSRGVPQSGVEQKWNIA